MYLMIPANTPMERFGDALPALSDWLRANDVDPANVSGLHPLAIETHKISGHDRVTGARFEAKTQMPMPVELVGYLATRFGAVYDSGDPIPDNASFRLQVNGVPATDEETAPLDDIAPLVDQLRAARADGKAAKEREDEAKAEILARLKATNREYGTVAGQRVVHAKTVVSNNFQTVKFRAAHPELAAEFTEPKTSVRLEIV